MPAVETGDQIGGGKKKNEREGGKEREREIEREGAQCQKDVSETGERGRMERRKRGSNA